MKRGTRRTLLVLGTILALGIVLAGTAAAQSQGGSFRIVRPEAPPSGCLEGARGDVTIHSFGPAEVMTVERGEPAPEHEVRPVPPPTTQESLSVSPPTRATSRRTRRATAKGSLSDASTGRPSRWPRTAARRRSFTVTVLTPDASTNPAFAPIHTYHLGLFFDSPGAARRGGCPDDGDAVQRGAQGRDQSPLHPQLPRQIEARCARSRYELGVRSLELGIGLA